MRLETLVDNKRVYITLNDVLHTPNFRSNLISVSKLGSREVNVVFNNDLANVMLENGSKVMTATRYGHLYAVNMNKLNTSTYIAQAKQSAVTFDTWH